MILQRKLRDCRNTPARLDNPIKNRDYDYNINNAGIQI